MKASIQSHLAAWLGIALLVALSLGPEPAAAISREVRGTTNTSINRNTNVNVNRNTNINVNRNVNVAVDVHGGGCCYHPVATAAAVTAAVVTTAAVVGSIVHTLPPACSVAVVNGISYQNCGGTWYQPQYAGTQVQYIVVTAPR